MHAVGVPWEKEVTETPTMSELKEHGMIGLQRGGYFNGLSFLTFQKIEWNLFLFLSAELQGNGVSHPFAHLSAL